MIVVRAVINWVAFFSAPLWILPAFLIMMATEPKLPQWAVGKKWLWKP